MTVVTRLSIGLAALVVALAFAGCDQTGGNVMKVTLTYDGCTYDGDATLKAGTFAIGVENQTAGGANFVLARLAEGFTAASIGPVLAKEAAWARSLNDDDLARAAQGELPGSRRPPLPQVFDFRHGGSDTNIGAGETSELPGGDPGNWVVICRIPVSAGGREFMWLWQKQYVAAAIQVTGEKPGVAYQR